MSKKLILIIGTLICLLSMGCLSYAGELPKTGSLTIIKPVVNDESRPAAGIMTFCLYDLGDFAFDYDPDDYDRALDEVEKKLGDGELSDCLLQKKTEKGSRVTFTDLPISHTYYVCMSTEDGEINHNYAMKRFLVTIPYTDENGNTSYNVTAEPKFENIGKIRNKSADSRGVDRSEFSREKGAASSGTISPDGLVTTNVTEETVPYVPDVIEETKAEEISSGTVTVPTVSEIDNDDKEGADPSKYKMGDTFNPKLAFVMGIIGISLMGFGAAFRKKESKPRG